MIYVSRFTRESETEFLPKTRFLILKHHVLRFTSLEVIDDEENL